MMALTRKGLTVRGVRAALWRTVEGVSRKHTFQMAAAMAYYFVLALFPALVLLSAVVSYLPINDLLNQVVNLVGGVVPPDSMKIVRYFVDHVIVPNRATLLSFGILGTLWSASGGFASAIEALDIAYEVEEGRPFWVTRPLAIGLTLLVGVLFLIAFAVMVVGPEFGKKLAEHHKLSWMFAAAWPYIHWAVSFGFTVLAVEFLYFIAPNVRQRFWNTLPGALISVSCWVALSYVLGVYFRSFAHFSKTYGALGAVVALMVWLYWNGFIMLLGAELNCELAKETRKGKIQQDEDKSGLTQLDIAA
ncbi:MAG TPA: YihY/virulence factor BrkB family protein [Candidatus Acidoferrales bacterium]|jgi:membrane protein|nr:YihY/virulence factor BrkB family protein [Candidatus Acidoferrales bacterium]